GAPIYRLPVTLHPPDGPSVGAVISLVGRDAAIALADGSILKPLQQVDVGALRGATVVTPRRTTLRIAAKGSRTGGIQTVIDGEFPLAALRGAAEEILATLPQQDDLIELEFLGDS